MRRRWAINGELFGWVAGLWAGCGFVAVCVVGLVYQNHDRHGYNTGAAWVHSPMHWLLPLWAAPFVIPLAAAVAVGLLRGLPALALYLWRNPPIHRVTEPVVDDLRSLEPQPKEDTE